jgi:hypothetical protein
MGFSTPPSFISPVEGEKRSTHPSPNCQRVHQLGNVRKLLQIAH